VPDLARQLDSLPPDPDVPLIPLEKMTPVGHGNFMRKHFKPALPRAGLPSSTRFHDLRHTYASLLIAAGGHPRAVIERLGHSSITVTLGTYGHLFPTLDEALTEALDRELAEGMGH
jgi:integrase